jgi:hypothetical protein
LRVGDVRAAGSATAGESGRPLRPPSAVECGGHGGGSHCAPRRRRRRRVAGAAAVVAPRVADGGLAERFRQLDRDGDGKVSREEGGSLPFFAVADRDQDGFLTFAERLPNSLALNFVFAMALIHFRKVLRIGDKLVEIKDGFFVLA